MRGLASPRQYAFWLILFSTSFSFPTFAVDIGDTSRLTVYGYLSQAWAISENESFLGIPEDGTTAYRNLALQLRFQLDKSKVVVLQVGHERRGESPIDDFRDDIELEWAFFQTNLGSTRIRVGRIPLPLGIYSELRDVGHLQPFYGPPLTIYGETSYSSESIDGIQLSWSLFEDRPWTLDLDVFGGESEYSEKNSNGLFGIQNTSDDFGFRAWLGTPVDGLRLGLNFHSFKLDKSLVIKPGTPLELLFLSADFTRDRFLLRTEIGHLDANLPFFDLEAEFGYVTAGWSPWPNFWVYLQYEQRDIALRPELIPDRTTHEDRAISVTYNFSVKSLLKLEYHDVASTEVDRPTVQGIELPELTYTILSFSVAF